MRKLGTHMGCIRGYISWHNPGGLSYFTFNVYQSGSFLGKSAVFSTVSKHFWSVEWCGLDFYGRCINVVGKKLKYINRHLKYVPYVLFIPSHMLYNLTLLYLVHILLLYNYVFYYYKCSQQRESSANVCVCVCHNNYLKNIKCMHLIMQKLWGY